MIAALNVLSRRDAMRVLAAGFTALQLPAAEPNAPLFFSRDQLALLDCLTDMIIPADAHSPGAHEAGVAPFIDKMAAEAITAEEKDSWRKGLSAVDELSNTKAQMPFMKASKEQRAAMLTGIANESNKGGPDEEPKDVSPAAQFFRQVKQTTAFLYYSSSVGIHNEMEYKGNVLLNQFVGYDAT